MTAKPTTAPGTAAPKAPSDDPAIRQLRDRRRRAMLATLLLSQGVPMLRGGDELGHTQGGNNNAYCQDNDLSWLQWHDTDHNLVSFCRRLIVLRAAHPVFRRRRFFEGRPLRGHEISDIAWLRPDGAPMTDRDWNVGFARSLAVLLNGDALPDPDPLGQQIRDDTFLILLNAHHDAVAFTTPPPNWATAWTTILDTTDPAAAPAVHAPATAVDVAAFSLQLLLRD